MYWRLAICILVDALGMLSYVPSLFGATLDIAWAPVSSLLLLLLFRSKEGMAGSVLNLIEELSPGLDFIPSLTITWVYVYLYKKKTP